MLNFDTHILLYALAGELKPAERRLLERDRWSISAIVLWEIAKLAQLGRIASTSRTQTWCARCPVHIWPLTREIALASTRLDVQGDPADE